MDCLLGSKRKFTASPIPLLPRILASAAHRRLIILEIGCGKGLIASLLVQMISGCCATVVDADEITRLNVRSVNPAPGSTAAFVPLNGDTKISVNGLNRHFDLIIVPRQDMPDEKKRQVVNAIEASATRSPKTLVIVAAKRGRKTQKSLIATLHGKDFITIKKTALSSFATVLEVHCRSQMVWTCSSS